MKNLLLVGFFAFFGATSVNAQTVLELLEDINPGPGNGDPQEGVLFNGQLFFEAETTAGSGVDEPFRYDGTNVVQITNGSPSAGDSNPTTMFVFNGAVYSTMESNSGRELFRYNAGTNTFDRVIDLNGAAGGNPTPLIDANGDLIIYNGDLMMAATDTAVGDELFRLRGDNGQLELASDVVPGPGDSDPGVAALFNGQLFFEALNAAGDDEPYRYNGTSSLLIPKDNDSPTADSNLTDQFVFNGNLYAVMDSTVGRELFRYNPVTDRYNLVINLNGANNGTPNPLQDANGDLIIFNGDLMMTATDVGVGDELFRIRQDNGQFELLADVRPGADDSDPGVAALFDNQLFFEALVGPGQDEPHRFDGSNVVVITNGAPSAVDDSNLTQQFAFSGDLYATMESNVGRELFIYNAATNTYDLFDDLNGGADGNPIPLARGGNADLIIFDGDLLMRAADIGTGDELFRLRVAGTPADLAISDASVTEGNAGTVTLSFSVTRTNNSSAIGVDFATANGSALADSDFTAASGSLSFAAGGLLSQTVAVTVIADTLVELDESVLVNLSNASGPATITDSQGVGSIINDDSASISINDVTANETAGTVNFTLTLNNAVDGPVSVDADTSAGTALAGSDYTSTSGTLNFSGSVNETETFTVPLSVDGIVELTEQFTAVLSDLQAGGRSVSVSNDTGTATIISAEAAQLSINDVIASEGDAGTVTFSFDVLLDTALAFPATVEFASVDDTATAADGDYQASVGTLNFAGNAGETQTISVDVSGDPTVEIDESFLINLSAIQAGGLDVTFSDSQGQGTIQNDDSASLSINDVSEIEGDSGSTSYEFAVTLDQAVDSSVSVDFTSNDGTATSGDNDFTAASGTLNFVGGAGEIQTLEIDVAGDATVELDEVFTVVLSNLQALGRDVLVADPQGSGTIQNDDSASLSIDDVTQVEGDTGTTTFDFAVTLDAAVDAGFSVDIASADDTATIADNDYASLAETLDFIGTVGETQAVSVTVNGDTAVEPTETFLVNLSNLSTGGRDVSLADGQGLGSITNDDAARLSIDDVTVSEGNAGTVSATFTVSATNAPGESYTVDFATADDSASAASDFTADAGTLSFTGTTADETATITVAVQGDELTELDETFFVNLSNVQGGGGNIAVDDGQGVGTINNDDATTLSIADISADEGDSATTTISFDVTADSAVDSAYTVDYASADDSATVADNDYLSTSGTLNFAGGAGEVQAVSITINGDAIVEFDESLLIDLFGLQASGRAVSIIDAQAVGSIINDDAAELSIESTSVTEGGAGAVTQMVFDVTLSAAVNVGLTVDFTTADDSALAAEGDYVPNSGTLTFAGAAGEVQQIVVDVNGDDNLEPTEAFTVVLSDVTASGIAVGLANGGTAQGTIITDETLPVPVSSAWSNTLLLLLMLGIGLILLRAQDPGRG